MAKSIRKLCWPSESPITLVYWDCCNDRKIHGEPLQRGREIHGVGGIGYFHVIFHGYRRLSWKWCEI